MSKNILEVSHLTHYFKLNKKVSIKAVDDVSFQVRKGEILGIVGESGFRQINAGQMSDEYL